jgi:hypothetical protein
MQGSGEGGESGGPRSWAKIWVEVSLFYLRTWRGFWTVWGPGPPPCMGFIRREAAVRGCMGAEGVQ